ncbi:uncharacterized protein LOC141820747 [Curcuma longa]|uniref:uncharacterized protein LOC141820747 n=1 Tax=Curcuma longa TaxID=136217 RepID=UPI003D9EDACE
MDPAIGRILLILFGILGNIISFMVYLSPIPTFIKIYRNKSARGFQSLPYNLSLFSCIIWAYYAYAKSPRSALLILINLVGCFIESAYIIIYAIYAPRKDRIRTIQVLVGLNLVLFSVIVVVTQFMFDGSNRAEVLGWICVAFSISVYAAPLSIIRIVVRTRSVEFMPIGMSFFLTLSATIWLGYGVFSQDIFVMIPTAIGFFFGVAQMAIYVIYKRKGGRAREADAEPAEDGAGEASSARASEFADAVEEEDDAASESSSFIVPVASIPILTSEVLIFIKKKDRRRARPGRSSRSATHATDQGSEPPAPSLQDLELQALQHDEEKEKEQRGKRVVEVEVGESSNTKEKPTVTEHITKIAEHIAMISGHIVKIAEMNPTPNPEPLDAAAAATAEEKKDYEEDQRVAMPSAVHEHVINMEKLTSSSSVLDMEAEAAAAAETRKSSKSSKRVKA